MIYGTSRRVSHTPFKPQISLRTARSSSLSSLTAASAKTPPSLYVPLFPLLSALSHPRLKLTDWTAHLPKEVLAKNFQTDISAFDEIPGSELYIFPSTPPSPDAAAVQDALGQVPQAFAYSFGSVTPTPLAGGSIKIADSTVFPIAQTVAVAEVTVVPGAMRWVCSLSAGGI